MNFAVVEYLENNFLITQYVSKCCGDSQRGFHNFLSALSFERSKRRRSSRASEAALSGSRKETFYCEINFTSLKQSFG